LNIQRARFEQTLSVTYDIDPDVTSAATPTLVLQSLVENAVIHGIGPAARPGRVSVRAARKGDQLLLEVADDGVGLPKDFHPGLGIRNTRERLRRLYAENQSFTLRNTAPLGVTATILIPLRLIPRSHSAERPP
jgi:LytS/YehU family sensor histidine kinase